LFHIGGLFGALQHLDAGGILVVLEQYDAARVAEVIEAHRVRIVQMVPAMLQDLLDARDIEARDLTSLRYVLYGGSPMPQALLERAREQIGCDFVQHYGSTESCGVATYLGAAAHHAGDPSRLGTVGVPFPGMEVRIV